MKNILIWTATILALLIVVIGILMALGLATLLIYAWFDYIGVIVAWVIAIVLLLIFIVW